MKKAGILFLFVSFLFTFSRSFAETITLHTDNDTYIDKVYPATNFGPKWNILTSGSPSSKLANGLLHFDFTSLPDNAVITDARLTFLVHGNHGTAKYVIKPLTTPWEEKFATWNLAGTGRSWTTPGGDNDSSAFSEAPPPSSPPAWEVTDVTDLVSEQGPLRSIVANNGLIIRADAGYNKILSSEFSTYANALTCHSCHGTNDSSLDVGKSTNCSQCHVRDGIRVSGDPALVIDYEPMLFQFVQVSDVHIGKSSQQLTNLSNTVAQINGINPAFVLFTGDLTDSGSVEQYTSFKSAVAGLAMPYYCVPGDNDIIDGEGTLPRYNEQIGEDYYAFDYRGFNFIGINNNSALSLDTAQQQWFESELQEGKTEIVFAHQPLLDINNTYTPYTDAAQLLSLLDAYAAPMYVNGHNHESASFTSNDTNFIWCKNLSYAHAGDPYNLYKIYADRILLYHVDLRDGSQTFTGSFPLAEEPTLITLASFTTKPGNHSVALEWSTGDETNNAGFNIYRAESEDGGYIKINNSLIPSKAESGLGASYALVDDDVRNRITYFYKLEDIDIQGVSTLHGPVSVTPRLVYGLRGK